MTIKMNVKKCRLSAYIKICITYSKMKLWTMTFLTTKKVKQFYFFTVGAETNFLFLRPSTYSKINSIFYLSQCQPFHPQLVCGICLITFNLFKTFYLFTTFKTLSLFVTVLDVVLQCY